MVEEVGCVGGYEDAANALRSGLCLLSGSVEMCEMAMC